MLVVPELPVVSPLPEPSAVDPLEPVEPVEPAEPEDPVDPEEPEPAPHMPLEADPEPELDPDRMLWSSLFRSFSSLSLSLSSSPPKRELKIPCFTRSRLWTSFTPLTFSMASSAIRFVRRASTVPSSVTSPLSTRTSMSDASMSACCSSRSLTSSRMRSSERV